MMSITGFTVTNFTFLYYLYYISPHVFAATEDEMKRPSVTIDTEVWSWGKNNRGQLGLGDMIDRYNDMFQIMLN